MITIDASDLSKRITNLQQMKQVKAAIKAGAKHLQGKIKKAPRVSRRPNMMLRGDDERAKRMRAGFFARLRSGEIEVPYHRGRSPQSQKLEQSWTITTEANGFRAIVGTNVSYAPLVQDADKQTQYHAETGWVTAQGVETMFGQEAIDFVRRALDEELRKG